jgi:hypothetical protein
VGVPPGTAGNERERKGKKGNERERPQPRQRRANGNNKDKDKDKDKKVTNRFLCWTVEQLSNHSTVCLGGGLFGVAVLVVVVAVHYPLITGHFLFWGLCILYR